MPRAIALRNFDHNGKVAKGETVEFDRITMEALRRSRLVGPDLDGDSPAKAQAPKAPVPTVGSLGKPGRKSSASQAAQASTPPTLPESTPGALPPPLPVKLS